MMKSDRRNGGKGRPMTPRYLESGIGCAFASGFVKAGGID
jgi:hypothetical protein